MADCPDIVGMELPAALELLQDAGLNAKLIITGPPRGGIGGTVRVLRVTGLDADKCELVAAFQGWVEQHGRPAGTPVEITRTPVGSRAGISAGAKTDIPGDV